MYLLSDPVTSSQARAEAERAALQQRTGQEVNVLPEGTGGHGSAAPYDPRTGVPTPVPVPVPVPVVPQPSMGGGGATALPPHLQHILDLQKAPPSPTPVNPTPTAAALQAPRLLDS